MKYSLDWIKDFCDVTLPLNDLSFRLLMLGFEVEGVEDVRGDTVLSVDVTPNRADCLSMEGLAREIAFACETEFRSREPELVFKDADPDVEVVIEAADLCPRYLARAVAGVKNGPGPDPMSARLAAVGLRPIDVLVDVTNYVQLEVGQPLHAFDRAKIRGGKIIVRRARARENITLLDGTVLELSPDDLVIADAGGPIALAGIMGAAGSEVGPSTTDVIIECAYFDPRTIRRTSKRYEIETESSYRFERGVDPAGIPRAADRAAGLMAEYAGGTVIEAVIDAGRTDWPTPVVKLRPSRANMLIGSGLSSSETRDILERLYMAVAEEGKDSFLVTIPTFRRDLTREADLVEEIARGYGYDRVVPRLPAGELPAPLPLVKEEAEGRLRELMVRAGFYEVYTNSFTSGARAEAAGVNPKDVVAVVNPISAEHTHLRPNIWPELAEVADYNGRQGERAVLVFELGTVFARAPKFRSDFLRLERSGVAEEYHLAALAAGPADGLDGTGKPTHGNFFVLKGALEAVAGSFDIGPVRFGAPDRVVSSAAERAVRPTGVGFAITAERPVEIGSCKGTVYELKLEYIPGTSYAAEVNVTNLMARGLSAPVKFVPPSRYPFVERDLALVVDATVPAGELLAVLEGTDPLLELAAVFDVYEGKGIPTGKKSVGLRLRYRADDRTLTDEEANDRREEAVKRLRGKFDVEVRGST